MTSNRFDPIQKRCIEYHAQQEKQSVINIEKSKDILKDLLYAHAIATGIFDDTIKKYENIPGKTDEYISEKLWLIAAFYQGIGICEELIKQARYTLAGPILRQEYEIVVKIGELNNGVYNKKKTANPKSFAGFQSVYGDLSELSHLLKNVDEIIFRAEEQDDKVGVKLIPAVDKDLCENLYGLHIYLIIEIVLELNKMYAEMYGYETDEEHDKYIASVIRTLLDRSIIKSEE